MSQQQTPLNIKSADRSGLDFDFDFDFSTIHEAVEISRRVAAEDFHRHLKATVDAVDESDSHVSFRELTASLKAFSLTDSASQELISAEAHFRDTTVKLLQGDQFAAERQAKASSEHLNVVAHKLEEFSNYAPQSKFFTAAFSAIVKADRLANKIETNVVLKVEDFTIGLKALAKRVVEFGSSVAQFPSKAADTVKNTGVTMTAAVVSTGAKFMSIFRDLLQKTGHKITDTFHEAVYQIDRVDAKISYSIEDAMVSVDKKTTKLALAAKNSAWAFIDESAYIARHIQQRVERAAESVANQGAAVAETVSRHGAVAAGIGSDVVSLSGGLLSKIGRGMVTLGKDVAADYKNRLDIADKERTARRASRP